MARKTTYTLEVTSVYEVEASSLGNATFAVCAVAGGCNTGKDVLGAERNLLSCKVRPKSHTVNRDKTHTKDQIIAEFGPKTEPPVLKVIPDEFTEDTLAGITILVAAPAGHLGMYTAVSVLMGMFPEQVGALKRQLSPDSIELYVWRVDKVADPGGQVQKWISEHPTPSTSKE